MKHIAFASKYRKDFKKRSKTGKRNIRKRWDRECQINDFRPLDDLLLPLTIMTWKVINHLTGIETILEFKQAFRKNGKPSLGKYEIFRDNKLWTTCSKTKALSLIGQCCPQIRFGQE